MTNNEKALKLVKECLDDWPYAATRVDDIMIRLKKVKALLKEQEEQIKTRDESLEKAREEIKWLRGMLKERNDNFDLYDTPIFGFHD